MNRRRVQTLPPPPMSLCDKWVESLVPDASNRPSLVLDDWLLELDIPSFIETSVILCSSQPAPPALDVPTAPNGPARSEIIPSQLPPSAGMGPAQCDFLVCQGSPSLQPFVTRKCRRCGRFFHSVWSHLCEPCTELPFPCHICQRVFPRTGFFCSWKQLSHIRAQFIHLECRKCKNTKDRKRYVPLSYARRSSEDAGFYISTSKRRSPQ